MSKNIQKHFFLFHLFSVSWLHDFMTSWLRFFYRVLAWGAWWRLWMKSWSRVKILWISESPWHWISYRPRWSKNFTWWIPVTRFASILSSACFWMKLGWRNFLKSWNETCLCVFDPKSPSLLQVAKSPQGTTGAGRTFGRVLPVKSLHPWRGHLQWRTASWRPIDLRSEIFWTYFACRIVKWLSLQIQNIESHRMHIAAIAFSGHQFLQLLWILFFLV